MSDPWSAAEPRMTQRAQSLIFSTPNRVLDAATLKTLQVVCECWYQIDRRSSVFCDRRGSLLASNSQANGFLRNSDCGISLVHGELRVTAKLVPRLKRILAAGSKPETVIIEKQNGNGHTILRSVAFNEDVVCILINDADEEAPLDLTGLEKAFGLTPAEADIIRLMLNGHSAADIAEDRGQSINTVRVHLRHCYDKLGVSSREQLWRKTFPYHFGLSERAKR